ncbi:hypothetical protein LTR96_011010 [Exophiala xenobiotica]|nr:hypothetical protein LTR92_011019 [Exophiala xenobiotica]KAK5263579.1 hypothetical protein LTR96_011010 [Exophiala xenobiotica]KAK5332951.1 hypothetical protein LTR98_010950 [Exophiala xenobiotica]KAK5400904.1 hypothetical protein LTR06_011119 [Exophiala xenobiotica]
MSSSGPTEETRVRKTRTEKEISADDKAALAAIGAEQVFHRRFNFWTALALGVCTSGTWAGISASIAQALICGGTVAVLYGFLASAVGMTCVAASLSELSSIWPSAGAQYVWVSQLSPARVRPLLSWIVVWLSFTSAWLGSVGGTFGVAVQTQAYITVAHSDYVPQRWHVTLLFWGYFSIIVLLNIFAIRSFHLMNIITMGVHITGFFVSMIVILATTKNKSSTSYVFTNFDNTSGWQSNGVSFLIGLLSTVYGFVGIEQPTHYAEEIKHVTKNLPRAFFANVAINAIITFPWLIVFIYCMGDIGAVLASPIGFQSPATQVYINSTGSVGAGIFINMLSTTLAFVSSVDSLGSAARILWSLARDKGLPQFLTKVHPRWDVPVFGIIVVAIPSYLIGIIYIFNSTAFYGIMAGQVVAMIISYMLPIALHLFIARRKKNIVYGPWTLGRLGWVTDAVSVTFTTVVAIFQLFPVYRPVTAANMNYSIVLNGAVLMFGTVSWYAYGKGRYTGIIPDAPAGRAAVIDGEEIMVAGKIATDPKK